MEIGALWNKGTKEEWENAINKYNEKIRDDRLEEYMNDLTPEEVKNMSGDEFFYFLREKYFVWKYTSYRSSHQKQLDKHKDGYGNKRLTEIHKRIFEVCNRNIEDTEGVLQEVIKIRGLGIAGASGLMAILYPEYYGTLDQFLIKSLLSIDDLENKYRIALEKMKKTELTLLDGVLLEEILRNKASELNKKFGEEKWTPKQIDMVLWANRDKK